MTVDFARDLVYDLFGIESEIKPVSFSAIDDSWVATFKVADDDMYYRVECSAESNEIVVKRFERTDYRICLKRIVKMEGV